MIRGLDPHQAAARECTQRLAGVPFVAVLGRHGDSTFEIIAGLLQISSEQAKIPERIEDHRDLFRVLVAFRGDRQSAVQCFLSCIPLPQQDQIDSQVVVANRGQRLAIRDVVRTLYGPNRDALGNLNNLVVNVEVVGGSGKVLSYLQSIDTSGDLLLTTD
jgi:hypothetical protein